MATALVVGSATISVPATAAATDVDVIRGTVLLPDGKPAVGAEVNLFAVADDVPDSRQQEAFASATTNDSGIFSVSIESKARDFVALALQDNGAFNYVVDINYRLPGVVGTEGLLHLTDLGYVKLLGKDLTDAIDKTNVNPSFESPGPDLDTTYVLAPLDGVAEAVTNTVSDPVAADPVGVADDVATATGAQQDTCRRHNISINTVVGREVRMEPVGELHAYYDATAEFAYGATANTDLGGAFKAAAGPWTVGSGTTHAGESGTEMKIKIGHHTGRTVRSQFRYRKERVDYYQNRQVCRTDYWIIPEGWTGGGAELHRDVSKGDSAGQFDRAKSNGNYIPFGPDSDWRKHQGKSHRYTFDVVAFGVTLHARSGWGNNVDIYWKFGLGDVEHDLYNITTHPTQATIVYSY